MDPRSVDDKETFDPNTGTVTRGSGAGQARDRAPMPAAKMPWTFLYFVRQELSQGRLPPRQTVFFGAPYEIRLDLAGTESVKIGKCTGGCRSSESVRGTGPSSNINFEMFFLQDTARTLALVRVPLALGTFSMELAK